MNNNDLLDFFAAMALQGLIAAHHESSPAVMAKVSYDLAEAMIKEKGERNE